MWRNYLPPALINPAPSSEESFESVESERDPGELVSPRRPPQSPSVSPRALLVPDPPDISEVLEGASRNLRNLPARQHRREQQQAAAAAAAAVAIMPDPVIVAFEDKDGVDEARALQEACNQLARFKWNPTDLEFYFGQIEIKMAAVGVKKNFTKFQVLATIIPPEVMEEVKPLLRLKETDFPNKDAYKQLKTELLSLFGPAPEAAVDRALARVMVGKPSSLLRALVNDICKKDLNGCTCCPAVVMALWKRHLPDNVRAGIADETLSKETFKRIGQLADKIFASSSSKTVAAVRVDKNNAPATLDETQPGLTYPVPEVAGVARGGRGGRGGRGFRGGRGRGGNRGGSAQSGTAQQSNTSGDQNQSGGQPRHRGPRHPDGPPPSGCSMHWKWGRSAFFCSEPGTCPWKNIFAPKPNQ